MSKDNDRDRQEEARVFELNWDIRRQGRRWQLSEIPSRREWRPEKIEMIEGKLFWSEQDRLLMLGLLLENVGVDKAVRLGDPAVWREALEQLGKST
jgi:hypothetical protein